MSLTLWVVLMFLATIIRHGKAFRPVFGTERLLSRSVRLNAGFRGGNRNGFDSERARASPTRFSPSFSPQQQRSPQRTRDLDEDLVARRPDYRLERGRDENRGAYRDRDGHRESDRNSERDGNRGRDRDDYKGRERNRDSNGGRERDDCRGRERNRDGSRERARDAFPPGERSRSADYSQRSPSRSESVRPKPSFPAKNDFSDARREGFVRKFEKSARSAPSYTENSNAVDVSTVKTTNNTSTRPSNPSASALSLPATLRALPVVRLLAGKARIFQEGNPIVYGGAVLSIHNNAIDDGNSPENEPKAEPKSGEEVLVADHHGNIFGRGVFNSFSQYRVRILAWRDARDPAYVNTDFALSFEDLLVAKLRKARTVRAALGLPSAMTSDAYRLVNSEGDALSGLIIDVLGREIVVHSSALWVQAHKETVLRALKRVFESEENDAESNNEPLIFRWKIATSRLQQDGVDVSSLSDSESETHSKTETETEVTKRILHERELRFLVDPATDQKTGFYCDQREHRRLLRDLVRSQRALTSRTHTEKELRALDLFCYSGGFALNALVGGAQHVLAVDSSLPALQGAEQNAALNAFSARLHRSTEDYLQQMREATDPSSPALDLVAGDCSEVMKALLAHKTTSGERDNSFDIIICDPPKLAPTRSSLERAFQKYVQINALAMQLARPASEGGALLLTCTCSAAMTQSEQRGLSFVDMVAKAAKLAGREISILQQSNAAPDHVVSPGYPESAYLTALLLHVH